MELKEIQSDQKGIWNSFVGGHKFGHFLQCFEWGDVLLADGQTIKRLAVFDKRQIIATSLVMKFPLPLNKSYAYMPRGPIMNWQHIHKQGKINKDQEALIMLLDEAKKFGQKENALFLRIDPEIEHEDIHPEFWHQIGFIKAPKENQPKRTTVVDLELPEDLLLKAMKSKTRYNIRLASRKGVKIKKSTNRSDIKYFYDLMLITSKRDKFYAHSKKHYEDIIKILGPENLTKIFLAEHKGKIISANIISLFGQKAIYLHGASADEYRNLMPTYLLQWEAILEAKKSGCKFYDFGGVVSEEETKHSWAGISRFKRGFGGKEKEFIGAWDLPYSGSQYRLFSFTNTIRRKIKGL